MLFAPVRPPKVGVVTPAEQVRTPVPVVSKTLFCKAKLFPSWSVP